jgi:septum formation protein
MPQLFLASASPRRAALLTQLGISFQVVTPTVEEAENTEGSIRTIGRLVVANALGKAKSVAAHVQEGLVIAGDTVVLTNKGRSLGKPETPENALAMLRQLVGTWHRVLSAVAVVDAATRKSRARLASARVRFRQVSDTDLRHYVETGEPLDKAGAYAIQGLGSFLVERVTGSYTAVVGFPVELVVDLLTEFGFFLPDHWVKSSLQREERS